MSTWPKIAVVAPVGLAAATLVLGGVASGNTTVVAEDGDAGQLPGTAQHVGDSAVAVTGSIDGDGDVDLYRVCVGDEGLSATTVNAQTVLGDTQLFVLTGDGVAVAQNDDSDGGYRSRITLAADSTPAGSYLVGVGTWDNDPLNAAGEPLFTDESVQVGPKALDDLVLAGWDGAGSETGTYRIDLHGAVACASAATHQAGLEVDVQPGSDENPINHRKRGRTPVAVLGSADVDATTVDPTTIVAGPNSALAAHTAFEDVNADGHTDLVAHFGTQELGLTGDATELCVTASLDGVGLSGCDAIWVR